MSIQFDLFSELRKAGLPIDTITRNSDQLGVHLEFHWVDAEAGVRHNLAMQVDQELFNRDPFEAVQLIASQFHAETKKANMTTTAGNYLISTAGSRSNTFYEVFDRSARVKPGEWYETGTRPRVAPDRKRLEMEKELARREAMILEETKRLAEEKAEKDAIASILETAKKRATP